jgi:iron complex transport system substrate-binding protein
VIRIAVLLCALVSEAAWSSELAVVDDLGRAVQLPTEPQRIISLAPHLTEMLFALGVGERIVATVAHSDFPPAAEQIPRLGDAFTLSVEAVVAVEPDLVVAWSTGGNQRTLQQLSELGYAIYQNEAATLNDIAVTLERLGALVGRPDTGIQLAADFRASLRAQRGSAGESVSVFFQISDNQLYTVNDQHLIGQAIQVCGAANVFGQLDLPVPMVSMESVIDADPDVILVSSPVPGFRSRWEDEWTRLGWAGRTLYIDASLITRPGPRMLDGIKFLCESLNSGRQP